MRTLEFYKEQPAMRMLECLAGGRDLDHQRHGANEPAEDVEEQHDAAETAPAVGSHGEFWGPLTKPSEDPLSGTTTVQEQPLCR